jgi:hypothetical protein
MKRRTGNVNHLRGAAAACALAVALLAGVMAPTAGAATTTQATCSDFGTKLAAAGAGDTIVLTGLCTTPNASFTLPAVAGLTIAGAPTGVNGFDGTGVGTSALVSPIGGTDGITLDNLTFEHYTASSAVNVATNFSATILAVANPFNFSGDTFSGNSSPIDGGGLRLDVFVGSFPGPGTCTVPGPTVSISDSTFSGNTAVGTTNGNTGAVGGGGGAFVTLYCSGSPAISITGNTFTGNTVAATGSSGRQGGGLFVGAGATHGNGHVVDLTQSDNVFDGNTITGTAADYGGGGELTVGANLTSSGDRFTNNSIPGSNSSFDDSEGGGLDTRSGGGCTSVPGATSVATNLVAAGNTIGAPSLTGTGGEGGGVYVGCSGTGAAAGVDGEATDVLTLHNTIVKGNSGGAELDGFGAIPGTNVTAANSDVCSLASPGSPFAGAGNVCAAPALVNPAPGAGDVHETTASPTIDVGSNAFVGATTVDAFGNPRVVPGTFGGPAIVDIGAAEFPTPGPPPPATATGQRAAALKKCKKKHSKKKRKKCRKKARKLPV